KHVTEHHSPVGPCVRAGCTQYKNSFFVLNTAVPGYKKLHHVGKANHRTGNQNNDVHFFHVVIGHDVFHAINFTGNQHKGKHHRKTGENGASHEIGREDGSVPAWNERHGKVEGYNGMN